MNKARKKKKKTTNGMYVSIRLIILVITVLSLVSAGLSAFAASYLVNSKEIKYDNSASGLTSTNVQDAIVELNNNATNYEAFNQRLTAVEDYKNKIYPVGSIYISVTNVNPGTLFGGTWVSFGSGKTIVGVNTGDSDFNTVEKTGGSKTRTLAVTNLPAHTHSIPALSGTAASAGAHTHSISGTAASAGAHTHSVSGSTNSTSKTLTASIVFHNAANGSMIHGLSGIIAGGNTQTNAYFTTTDLVRYGGAPSYGSLSLDATHSHNITGTAASNGAHTHSVSGTAASAGAHTHTVSTNASTSGSTGSGTAFSVMDPYITVYMWKRTA